MKENYERKKTPLQKDDKIMCKEIIYRFKDYFTKRGYHILNSFPLLPTHELDELDGFYEFAKTYRPSIGTNVSMKILNQGKDPFAIVQKCYRHMDIKENRIGDGRHLGFFRMVGAVSELKNKVKIVSDIYQFMQSLGINRDRIWATYFGGDQLQGKVEINISTGTIVKNMAPQFFPEDIEMKNILASLDLPKERITPVKGDINFTGLIASDRYGGARAHLYYELTQKSCSNDCYPEHNEKCKRFLEICVFVQEYLEKKENKPSGDWKFKPIISENKKRIIGSAIGIERLAMLTQNVDFIEKIDTIVEPLSSFNKSVTLPLNIEDTQSLKLLILLQSALFLISDGGKLSTRKNRDRELKELLSRVLKIATIFIGRKENSKVETFIKILLLQISGYFKDEYPELSNFVDKTTEYILKQEIKNG